MHMSKSVYRMILKTDTAHRTMEIFVITSIAGLGSNTEQAAGGTTVQLPCLVKCES